jgi:hypothetical protein
MVSARLARKLAGALWRVLCVVSWCLLGLWTALAELYGVPLYRWLAVFVALGIVLLYLSALRERFYVSGRTGLPWRELRRSIAALAVTAMVAVWYFGFMTPSPDLQWILKHARMPHVEVEGDKVHVSNVRDFIWRTPTDFTPQYHDRVYDLNALSSVYYVLSPIFNLDEVAHVWMCFGFADGQHVAVSVEARLVQGGSFRLLGSLFREMQLIYVIGEERDVVGLRGAIWKNEVRFFPARATKEQMRALFLDMMARAHSLEEHPEFYNLFANNCLNNVTYHLRRLGVRSLPGNLRLVLTGFSDRLAYEYGFLDTDLPFEKAHQAFRIDEWMRQTPLDEGFSKRLRKTLRRQGADKAPDP